MLENFDEERVCDPQDHIRSRERREGGREEAAAGLGGGMGRGGGGQRGRGTYGACVRVVNSLNSLSWMVK